MFIGKFFMLCRRFIWIINLTKWNTNIPDLNCLNSITNKIKNFDFDTFEYDFKLENDVLEEYASKIEYTIQENANDNEENEEETESSWRFLKTFVIYLYRKDLR